MAPPLSLRKCLQDRGIDSSGGIRTAMQSASVSSVRALCSILPNVGVLLPVRLETRFDRTEGDMKWRLRVLVVPDEPSIDRHDPVPSHAELDSVEQLWQMVQGDLDSE